MQTDKFKITQDNIEKILDKIERFAMCYDFSTKKLLHIRLLAEECISLISPTLELSNAWCFVSTTENTFNFTVDCDAGNDALDTKTKETLLKIGKGNKKGAFGMISKVFDFLTMPEANLDTISNYNIISMHHGASDMTGMYYWAPQFIEALPEEAKKEVETTEPETDEGANLEISIVEGYADNIEARIQKLKGQRRLYITIAKTFSDEQLNGVIIENN